MTTTSPAHRAWLTCALCIGLCSYLLGSNQSGSQASFRRVAIVDGNGRERIILGTKASALDQPELNFLDAEGRIRLTLDLEANGLPEILLRGQDEKPRTRLAVDGKDSSSLTMGIPMNGSLIMLQVGGKDDKWAGALWVKDSTGKSLLESKYDVK